VQVVVPPDKLRWELEYAGDLAQRVLRFGAGGHERLVWEQGLFAADDRARRGPAPRGRLPSGPAPNAIGCRCVPSAWTASDIRREPAANVPWSKPSGLPDAPNDRAPRQSRGGR